MGKYIRKNLSVKITDYVPEFIQLIMNAHGDKVFTRTKLAIQTLGASYQQIWRSYASGAMKVPGAPTIIKSKGDYTRSIQVDHSNPNFVSVFSDMQTKNGMGITALIESGHKQIDLKPGILSGRKARMGKFGPYNIIAFRHGTPKASRNPMPMSVYNLMLRTSKKADVMKEQGLAKSGGQSKVTGQTPNGRRTYDWGASLDGKMQRGRRSKLDTKYTWKSGKYAGMRRMQTNTGRAKNSNYITFRIVSYKSAPNSWILPAKPAIPIRQAVIDFMAPFAEKIIRQAIEEDLA